MRTVFCFIVAAISRTFSYGIDQNPFSDEFIDYINSQQITWTAGRNFDKNTPLSHIRNLLGAIKPPELRSERHVAFLKEDRPIPESFDSRENWPNCQIIGVIKDQSACSSCWAVAATSVMSDRICIHSNGETQIYVSDEDLLSCCSDCGKGCQGGYHFEAWGHWYKKGLVSGGLYNSTTGCRAYSMPPCEHQTTGSKPACPKNMYPTPRCNEQCDEKSSLSYQFDKSYGQKPYYVSTEEKQIQLEILKNGPVEAVFDVYTDFVVYKSGVYHQVAGEIVGGHAVRVLGWGVENGTAYWLAANSWNEDWGDKGLFKIIRGRDECDFEGEMVAGLPKKAILLRNHLNY
ncbi:cathepsin B [Leptinotarsa decemlineata]|uniref:cathepsin B n=1 Tax=Leptinotarsa decemlineata TaxID=7539 RepID=UPI003D30C9B0